MSAIFIPPGLKRLGLLNFASTGASQGPITIAPCKLLWIEYFIAGYSAGDVAAFQFNADTTATNYGSFFASMTSANPPVLSSVANAGTTAMIPVGGNTITIGRRGAMRISNVLANRKVARIETMNESTTSSIVSPSEMLGWGEWLNTTAQITQVKMLTKGGANLLAGSFAIIYGDNP